MAIDKVEAVKKVTETLSKHNHPAAELEQQTNRFDSLMANAQTGHPSFEVVDTRGIEVENVQKIESNPVFGNEQTSAQRSGTATDQENKKKQQDVEEIEGVSGTRSKNSSSSASKSNSLMDEVSKLNKNVSNISHMGPEHIKKQAKEVISQIESVKTQLSQAGDIKPSYQSLLRNRLTHIDDSLKIALNKAGVEYTPQIPTVGASEEKNAVHKFLSFLTNSQHQLETLDVSIDKVSQMGQISPANMLAIQMKMGYVQQQIELFTSLLNKALESTKTIMNVQV